MNIWIFNHYATAPSHVGGTRHYDLAKELVDRGYSVTIFASSFNHFSKKEMVFDTIKTSFHKEVIDGISYIWLKTPPYNNSLGRIKNILSYTLNSYLRAKKEVLIDNPDIIIGSSVHPLAAIVGYLMALKTKSKFYFEERDLWPQTFVDFQKISPKNPIAIILYRVERYLYEKADKIIVLFNKAPDYVRSRGIDSNKVIYLPNGVNYSNFLQMNEYEEIDNIFEPFKDKVVVVYAGSHGEANHLDSIINLFKQVSNEKLHLLMIGDGPEKGRLIQKAQKYKLNNITFENAIPKEKIPYLLNKANIGIISVKDSPLYKWGFSMNKLFDYMAAELPIVMVTNPTLVGDLGEKKGIIVNNSLKELAQVLDTYANDPVKQKNDGVYLREYVQEKFSWSVLADHIEKAFIDDIRKVELNEKNI